MTFNQLETLTDGELVLVLYVVNVIAPLEFSKITFTPRQLTWFKHQELRNKLLTSFNRLKPEGHATYVSLMQKLGVCVQIKQQANEPPEKPGNMSRSLSLAIDKYKISPQLTQILLNTITDFEMS